MMGLLCLCDLDPFCVCVDGGWSCPGHMHHATAEPGTRDPAVGMSTGGTVGLLATDWGEILVTLEDAKQIVFIYLLNHHKLEQN